MNIHTRANRLLIPAAFTVLPLLLIMFAGCVRMQERIRLEPLPPGSPSPHAILEDLAENQEKLRNFKAFGTFYLESPQLTGKLRGRGTLNYERPDRLFVNGRDLTLNVPVFELTATGAQYLLWLPRDKQLFHSIEGIEFEGVPFRVSPADIVREMFLPEGWDTIPRRDVYLEAYDPQTQRAILLIGPPAAPRRRIEVTGAPWMLTRNELLDQHGATAAVTTYNEHTQDPSSGMRFAGLVRATFFAEDTILEFRIRRLDLNIPIPAETFDVEAKLADPQIRQYLVQ
jgi:hypothetical protein